MKRCTVHFKRFSDLQRIFENEVTKLPRENKVIPRIEALRLYRKVLKFSNEFTWSDENGFSWKERIRKSAREEFELSREEKDPFVLNQMMVTVNESIRRVREKLIKKYSQFNQDLIDGKNVATIESQVQRLKEKPHGSEEGKMEFGREKL